MPDTPDISYFRKRLLEMHTALQAALAEPDGSQGPIEIDQCSVGRLARMDAIQERSMAADTRLRGEQTLQKIKTALKRCDAGSYGYCLGCEQPIDPGRLEVDPATILCRQCAEARSE